MTDNLHPPIFVRQPDESFLTILRHIPAQEQQSRNEYTHQDDKQVFIRKEIGHGGYAATEMMTILRFSFID